MGRRALRLRGQGQRSDGLLPACVPAWYDSPHADFSLLYVLLLRDFWSHSGDRDLVRELWPVVQKIFASPIWKSDETGLWEATPQLRLFLDWGIPQVELLGKANGALNALRVGALQAAGELAQVISEDTTSWKNELHQVTSTFGRILWRPARRDFAPFAGENDAPAHHANALALRFCLGTPDQETGIQESLKTARQHLANPNQLRANGGHLELFFLHFMIESLAARGLHEEASDWIRAAWGPIVKAGAITFWETLNKGLHGLGSLCHAWSCAPNWFLAREVLGVRPVVAPRK